MEPEKTKQPGGFMPPPPPPRYADVFHWPEEAPVIASDSITERITADIVIVGSGHAGTQCALAAAEGGASVVVLEKKKEKGFRWMGEQVGHYNSQFLISRGLGPYNLDDIIDEYCRCSAYRCNPQIISQYVRNSGEMFDHMISLLPSDTDLLDEDQCFIHQAYGNPEYPVVSGGTRTWAGTVQFRGKLETRRGIRAGVNQNSRLPEVVSFVRKRAEELGARWFFGTEGVLLTKDGDRVTGVIAKNEEGNYVQYNASKAVVLSTGNFTDAGHKLGAWAGGRMENIPFDINPVPGAPGATDPWGDNAFLMLNRFGKRFMNESVTYGFVPAMNRQPKGLMSRVTDSKWFEQIKLGGIQHGQPDFGTPLFVEQMCEDMSHVMEYGAEGYDVRDSNTSERHMGHVYGAETLDELADMLGYAGEEKTEWLRSVERYNELCALGCDLDFGKDPKTLLPIDTPPFYGTKCSNPGPGEPEARYASSLAGLDVDGSMNVLNRDGIPIPGLYAGGNCLGGRYGTYYPTPCGGNYIGSAMTLGRVLGKQLAAL